MPDRGRYTAAVPPLSAVLITCDEERNLPDALASVAFCDDVVVLDGGSRDRTRELAAAAGARVQTSEPWPGFVEQRNRAVAAARHDWVLAIDADERVTPELRDEIRAEAAKGFAHAGYRIPRLAFYLGRWIRGTDWWPDPQLRLFDRRRGRWQGGLIHESVRVDGHRGAAARAHGALQLRRHQRPPGHHRPLHDALGGAGGAGGPPQRPARSGPGRRVGLHPQLRGAAAA